MVSREICPGYKYIVAGEGAGKGEWETDYQYFQVWPVTTHCSKGG